MISSVNIFIEKYFYMGHSTSWIPKWYITYLH